MAITVNPIKIYQLVWSEFDQTRLTSKGLPGLEVTCSQLGIQDSLSDEKYKISPTVATDDKICLPNMFGRSPGTLKNIFHALKPMSIHVRLYQLMFNCSCLNVKPFIYVRSFEMKAHFIVVRPHK